MERETFRSFFAGIKDHAQTWLEAQVNVIKLKGIRILSKIMGNVAWLIISLFLFLLFSVFVGLTLGFWLSSQFESYTIGFGIVSLLILFKMWILYLLRKQLFINPVIRMIIRQCYEKEINEENKN